MQVYYSDGNGARIIDVDKLKHESDILYELNKEELETSQTRSVYVNEYKYSSFIKDYWENPDQTKGILLDHPGLSFIESITNCVDSDIFLKLNDIEIPISAMKTEKFDLDIRFLVFVSKYIKYLPKYEFMDFDDAMNLLNPQLPQKFGIDKYIYEFVNSNIFGICYDVPERNAISKTIPPFFSDELTIENDHSLLEDDLKKTNIDIFRHGGFITKTGYDYRCDKEGCCVLHYDLEYSLTDEQIQKRIQINSREISYSDLCTEWKKFCDNKINYLVKEFIANNKSKHQINEDNQILFPVNIIGKKICEVTGDLRKTNFGTKIWRKYIIMNGMIGEVPDNLINTNY